MERLSRMFGNQAMNMGGAPPGAVRHSVLPTSSKYILWSYYGQDR